MRVVAECSLARSNASQSPKRTLRTTRQSALRTVTRSPDDQVMPVEKGKAGARGSREEKAWKTSGSASRLTAKIAEFD